jgi:hypothetical protein
MAAERHINRGEWILLTNKDIFRTPLLCKLFTQKLSQLFVSFNYAAA